MAPKKPVQVVPTGADYLLQSNQISRAAHDLSLMQARLVYLAMAQVRPTDDDLPVVEMNVGDIVRALGLGNSTKSYIDIRAAVRGTMTKVLDLDTPDGWIMHHWFSKARYIKTRDAVQIQFDEELKPYIIGLQEAFSILTIADLSKLSGRYAMRLFEIIMSYRGLAGKGGNKPGCWFVDLKFDHLRDILKINPEEYKLTKNFRVRVIDGPVREINEAGLGLRLECDYEFFRHGRKLLGVRLLAKETKPGEPRTVTPATKAEQEELDLIALNPELWQRLLTEEPADLFGGVMAREGNAYQKLLKHPDLKKPAPKRSKKL